MISFHFLNKYFSIILAPNRSNPYAYDNRVFHTETPNNLLRPIKDTNIYEHVSTTHSPRPPSQMSEIEAGRTKLHRLLDEVLDKAEQVQPPTIQIQKLNGKDVVANAVVDLQ